MSEEEKPKIDRKEPVEKRRAGSGEGQGSKVEKIAIAKAGRRD